ncbi:ORF6N domain-containing protein [Salipiger marinus]|uniref:ORF6N domain-containing protein n=1 Tax=Salipiger marinus TaxID=555512 RepID=UPI002D1A5B5D|nr:ORF6N domain-containing protein [Salipiger manganoxidans]MEB3421910.1 ORF6N domain-containing protein [Salipiger manganoxidans]
MTFTLETVSGIRTRIFTLPDRPPFMIAADLAEVYATRVDAITQAIRRNPERFPEDFVFSFTEAEMEVLKTQNVFSMKANRALQRGFTHAGAYGVSAVLKTPVAARVSVIVHRAFAEMEQRAIRDAQSMLAKFQSHVASKAPYARVSTLANAGLSVDEIWRATGYPRRKVEDLLRECARLQMISSTPVGSQPDLFAQP